MTTPGRDVLLLDGAMGGELIRRGLASRGGLWSAQALVDAPEGVVALHRDYIAAGARVITTNTYSTVPSYLAKQGMGERVDELTELAARLAREAVTDAPGVLVVGSLPPLSESYRPDLSPDENEAAPVYRQLAQAMAPYVDGFLCETMASAEEARIAATQAREVAAGLDSSHGKRSLWVSWTLDDEPGRGLRSGEGVDVALEAVEPLEPDALLFNCARPESIVPALIKLRSLTTLPIGAYPNRMESIPEGWTLDNDVAIRYREDLGASVLVESTRRFVECGASLVGGCCGVGPEDIAAIAADLEAAESRTAAH